jgi:hypothetical protein
MRAGSTVSLDPMPSGAGLGRPSWVDPYPAEADRWRARSGDLLSGLGEDSREPEPEADTPEGMSWYERAGINITGDAAGRIFDWLGLKDKSHAQPDSSAADAARRAAAERSASMTPILIGGGILATAIVVGLLMRRKK